MKKALSTLLVCVILVGCVFSLASCGMVTGTYKAGVGDLAGATYDFSAFGGVTITVGVLGVSTSFEGKYKVDSKTDEITFTFEDEDAQEYSGTFSFTTGKEDGVKYVKIGGVKYNEVD